MIVAYEQATQDGYKNRGLPSKDAPLDQPVKRAVTPWKRFVDTIKDIFINGIEDIWKYIVSDRLFQGQRDIPEYRRYIVPHYILASRSGHSVETAGNNQTKRIALLRSIVVVISLIKDIFKAFIPRQK